MQWKVLIQPHSVFGEVTARRKVYIECVCMHNAITASFVLYLGELYLGKLYLGELSSQMQLTLQNEKSSRQPDLGVQSDVNWIIFGHSQGS